MHLCVVYPTASWIQAEHIVFSFNGDSVRLYYIYINARLYVFYMRWLYNPLYGKTNIAAAAESAMCRCFCCFWFNEPLWRCRIDLQGGGGWGLKKYCIEIQRFTRENSGVIINALACLNFGLFSLNIYRVYYMRSCRCIYVHERSISLIKRCVYGK